MSTYAEEYLFDDYEEAFSDDEQTEIELREKYLTYDEEMEMFEDEQYFCAYEE